MNPILKTLAVLLALPLATVSSAESELTIIEIMEEAHKGGLLKRVQVPTASEKDKARLLELYKALKDLTPPAGDKSDWAERTQKMIAAATLAKDGDPSKLKRAVNCRDCHTYHKE